MRLRENARELMDVSQKYQVDVVTYHALTDQNDVLSVTDCRRVSAMSGQNKKNRVKKRPFCAWSGGERVQKG